MYVYVFTPNQLNLIHAYPHTYRFETNIPQKLAVENVVHRDLSHKLNENDEQLHLVDRYTQLYNK